jgi:hypothetical protein
MASGGSWAKPRRANENNWIAATTKNDWNKHVASWACLHPGMTYQTAMVDESCRRAYYTSRGLPVKPRVPRKYHHPVPCITIPPTRAEAKRGEGPAIVPFFPPAPPTRPPVETPLERSIRLGFSPPGSAIVPYSTFQPELRPTIPPGARKRRRGEEKSIEGEAVEKFHKVGEGFRFGEREALYNLRRWNEVNRRK